MVNYSFKSQALAGIKLEQFNNILLAALTASIIFIICPLFLLERNLNELVAIQIAESFWVSGWLFLVAFVVFLSLSQFKILKGLIFILLVYATLTTLFFPVTLAKGMVVPQEQPVNMLNLLISLIITSVTALICLKSPSLRKIALTFIGVVACLNFATALYAVASAEQSSLLHKSDFGHLSKVRNILVLSFDGIPGPTLTQMFSDENADTSTLRDFTYFTNVHSQSPATVASIIGEVYGVQDYKAIADTENELVRKLNENETSLNSYRSALDDFQKHHYDTGGTGEAGIGSPGDTFPNTYLVENSFSRIFTRHFYKTKIPLLVEKVLYKPNATYRMEETEAHKGPKWDRKNVRLIDQYDDIVESMTAEGNSDLTVRFYHSRFSHFPIDFDETCRYKSDSRAWFEANQNENGLKNQTRCVLKKIDKLISKLREIGAYDNSLIVIKSDHGEPYLYFDDYPENAMLNQSAKYGYNRYRPFMMIKDTQDSRDSLKYDSRHVLLNDLAITLCKASMVQGIDCKTHGGINLLSDEKGLDQPYYVYMPKSEKSNFKYDTHFSLKVPNRRISLLEFLEQSPSVDVEPCLPSDNSAVGDSECRVRAKRGL